MNEEKRTNEIIPTNQKEILQIHNNLINAIFSLSVDAKKLLLIIWLHADFDENNRNNIVKIYCQDIQKKVGIDIMHLNPKHREEIISELMTKIITIRDIDNSHNFIKFTLLRDTVYKDGLLKADISPYLIPYIREAREKLFTKFKIQNIKPLTSVYAIRIYLLCKQFEDTGWLKVKIDDLKRQLELEKKYKRIYDLKKYVLEIAKKQINENTDIEIDYELERKGRRYVNIIFKIKSKIKNKPVIIKEIKNIREIEGVEDSFNTFRKEILSKINEDQVIILNDNIYKIKHNLLYLDDKLLDKEEALDHWHLLYENKDKIEIKNIEELKKENLKRLENRLNESYKGKKTFIIVNREELKVVVVKVEVVDIDKIKVIFKAENGKFYMAEYSSIDSLKNL